MKSEFNDMLKAYVELEGEVREYISGLFSGTCALCTSTCCTPYICEESLASAFLKYVHSVYKPEVSFCDRYGWLTERGCALKCGRPPVCYGFFCDDILDSLSARERGIIRVLGRIISWVGEKAYAGKHIVEIMDSEDLNRINLEKMVSRLKVGKLALDGVKEAFGGDPIGDNQLAAMQQINPGFITNR